MKSPLRAAFVPMLAPALCLLLVLLVSACEGTQSMFRPAGAEAARVLILFWMMVAGFTVVLVGVLLATACAWQGPERWRRRLRSEGSVLGLGLAFPIALLSLLLGAGPARGRLCLVRRAAAAALPLSHCA